MKPLSLGYVAGYAGFVAVSALLGISLTRTTGLRGENEGLYAAGGAVMGLLLVIAFHAIKDRVALLLPPPQQLRGLKIFLAGFAVAVLGWLVATLVAFDVGINITFIGVMVCFVGTAVHLASAARRR